MSNKKYFNVAASVIDQALKGELVRVECKNTLNVRVDPQEGMREATGMDEEDWEEYEKYLDGKLPLERDR